MPEPRNWADLPSELLYLISRKLPPDLLYFLPFRSVCKNWRSSAPLSDPPPRLPWLIECQNSWLNGSSEQNLRFYSLVSSETGTIRVPESYRGKVYYGPSHGYLLVSSPEDLYLFNPLTCDVISLPKLDHGLRIDSPVCSGSDPIRNWHIVSSLPDPGIYGMERWMSVMYHPDTNNWTYVGIDFCGVSCNTCCLNGKLFATERECSTWVFDDVSGEKLYEVPPPEDEGCEVFTSYLVESCGEVLRICWYLGDEPEEVEFSTFDIYKLNFEGGGGGRGGQPFWVKVSDIGDQIVFLDQMNGFSMTAPAGFKENCIYFLPGDVTPCRYDIGTDTVEMMSCPFNNCTWFIPNLS